MSEEAPLLSNLFTPCITQAHLPCGKPSEPSLPGPAQVAGITPVYQGHSECYTFSPYKNFFLNQIINIFTFTSSIISIITITLLIYLFCKHKHIRTIVASLILHKAKEVEARTSNEIDNPECSILAYIGITLTLLSMAIVILLHYRKSKFCRG